MKNTDEKTLKNIKYKKGDKTVEISDGAIESILKGVGKIAEGIIETILNNKKKKEA